MQSIDLNLLPVAQALLSAQSVTRAAERLHLSVPATSRALERCRRAFGDPLLVRSGRGVVITPRGVDVLTRLDPLIDQIDELLRRPGPFDASTLRRTFVVRANEAVIAAVGSALLVALRAEAPHIHVRFVLEAADDLDALRAGDAALAIGSYSDVTGDVHTEHLLDERLVGVLSVRHPLAAKRMTLARFAALDHVVTSRLGRSRGPVDEYLAQHGRERRIVAVVPSFAAALAMCVDSQLTTIAPSRLASLLGGPAGLAMFEPPMPLGVVHVNQLWHARFTNDPAHHWLRQGVRRVARELDSDVPPARRWSSRCDLSVQSMDVAPGPCGAAEVAGTHR